MWLLDSELPLSSLFLELQLECSLKTGIPRRLSGLEEVVVPLLHNTLMMEHQELLSGCATIEGKLLALSVCLWVNHTALQRLGWFQA